MKIVNYVLILGALVMVILPFVNSHSIENKIVSFSIAVAMLLPFIKNNSIRYTIAAIIMITIVATWWKFWA